MAIVNKQSGDQSNELGGSGQPIDFDPNDPDTVKVHYDVSSWNFDQRAELSEALANDDLPHFWDDDELVVPEIVEGRVDALFERLEKELGPFPIVLVAGAESTEFGLDEWSSSDRSVLTDALIDAEVPHRWEGATVVVAADTEHVVDDLLDAVESGELLAIGADDGEAPPEGALSAIFLAADKLAKDPGDAKSRTTLIDLHGQLNPKRPPYGLAQRTWEGAVAGVGTVVDHVIADAHGGAGNDTGADGAVGADADANLDDDTGDASDASSDSSLIGAAQELRSLVRPYV